MMKILLFSIILSLLSGYLYRQGGSEDKPEWLWKARDVGCSLCVLAWLNVVGISSIYFVICFGLMWGALSSYWGWLSKSDDEVWWNYLLHGFFIGIALFPLAITGDLSWLLLLYRSLFLGCAISVYSHFITEPVLEEFGRGFMIVATLPLLLIGG